jgi:1-acyl-sn-glycerol-3-phosphate acyltransferase
MMGMICIDRDNLKDAKESLNIAANQIRDNGYNIAIAPEGTRRRKGSDFGDHSNNLAEFKKGPFHTAKNGDCAFVPVCIFGANRLARPGSLVYKQGNIFFFLGKREFMDYGRHLCD